MKIYVILYEYVEKKKEKKYILNFYYNGKS